MRSKTALLPKYDFSDALAHTAQERLGSCLQAFVQQSEGWEDKPYLHVAPVPSSGASDEEITRLEKINEIGLPGEYRDFLRCCRYLSLADGLQIYGISRVNEEGVSDCSPPWLSDEHPTKTSCWVIGDYWRYADGDQLLILPREPGQPVMLYLHEHGPLIEQFAPSFSLALWRITHGDW